jgi:hypothetical protein
MSLLDDAIVAFNAFIKDNDIITKDDVVEALKEYQENLTKGKSPADAFDYTILCDTLIYLRDTSITYVEDIEDWGKITTEDMMPVLKFINTGEPIEIMKDAMYDSAYCVWMAFIEKMIINAEKDEIETDAETEWETLYGIMPIEEGKTILLQTYGGGPEGGYALEGAHHQDNGNYVFPEGYKVYSAHRNWGIPWQLELLKGKKIYFKGNDDGEEIRVVDTDEVIENDDEDVFMCVFGVEI